MTTSPADRYATAADRLDAALDEWMSTVAARFPVRAALLRRLARRPWWRAVIIRSIVRHA